MKPSSTIKPPLRVLHIEDSSDDSELIQHLLRKNDLNCEICRIETRDQLFQELEHSQYDLIFSDCALPKFNGFQALEIARALKPEVPFIFISGTIGEETAIKSLQEGATDYVLKHRMARLVPSVRRALADSSERAMLRALKTRLAQTRRLEAIGTLAGGFAHDFNNLLQVLKAHIDLLPLQIDHPDQIIKTAEILNKFTDRGSELMQELLVFAQKTDAHFTAVKISDLIEVIVEAHKIWLPQNMKIILQMDENLPLLFADPSHLDRIFTNLILNARDAMPQGGNITISAEVVHFDPRTSQTGIGIWADTHHLCFKVADTGIGMDESSQLQVFEPFFTTKSLEKGTGLGLSVVFGLMQIHNGLIDFESKPGKGTTVSLFFPLPQDSKIEAERIKKIPSLLLREEAARNN